MFFLSFGILNWLITFHTSNVDAGQDMCTDWKLYGGRAKYEGIVMVKYNGTYLSLCHNENLSAKTICRKTKNYWPDEDYKPYVGNVFDVNLDDFAITRTCRGKSRIRPVCGADDMDDCCQPVGICCLDTTSREICSASWSEIYHKQCHHTKGDQNLDYFKARSIKVIKGFSTQKAWTKSALDIINQTCIETTGSARRAVLKQCAYNCLNNDSTNSTDNCTCIYKEGSCNCTLYHNGSECSVQLIVLKTEPANISRLELCIAGTVTNGAVIFTAEDCNLFLQPLCLINGTSQKDRSHLNSSENDNKVDSTMSITISCVVAFLLIFIIIIIICKLRTCDSKGESFRSNSMFNRTYGRQLQRQQAIDNEEEYAIISEIELDSGTSFYKPRLPDRNNLDPTYNKIESDGDKARPDIITLDEYSTPSDMIKDKDIKYDPASDYTTTYDDPIRHNEQNIVECKRKSEVKETLETDKNFDTSSLELHDDKTKACESYESIAGVCKDAGTNEKGLADQDEPESKNDISLMIESKERGAEECSSSQSEDTSNEEIKVGNTEGYEDTNIIDGNFPAKPKKIFEEHVCLNCLKPEHLERLGIRIITEDKALESIEGERLMDESGDDISTDNSIDSDGNINRENGRECVICKNVYDCLGNLKIPTVTKSDSNEYDHVGNYKESVL